MRLAKQVYLSGKLHQVELVLLANLVGADQLETTRGLLSWHQVYCVLQKFQMRIHSKYKVVEIQNGVCVKFCGSGKQEG